jgi:hypothetical protein
MLLYHALVSLFKALVLLLAALALFLAYRCALFLRPAIQFVILNISIPYHRVIQYHIRYGHLRSAVPYVMPEIISPFIYDQIPGWMEMTKDRTYQYVQATVSTVTLFSFSLAHAESRCKESSLRAKFDCLGELTHYLLS